MGRMDGRVRGERREKRDGMEWGWDGTTVER